VTLTLFWVLMNEKVSAEERHGMDRPVDVDNKISSQDQGKQPPLVRAQNPLP